MSVKMEDCPDSSVHGNPFRYCPYCEWVEVSKDDGRFGPTDGGHVFASPQITTEDLLSMRVAPEQRADLAAVMDAFGLAPSLQGLTAEEQIANLTRQRDAWRNDALTAEQRIDALKERLADRDAALAAAAQSDVHKPFTDDGVTYCGWDGHEGCGEVWPCSTVRAAAPVGGQAEPSNDPAAPWHALFSAIAGHCTHFVPPEVADACDTCMRATDDALAALIRRGFVPAAAVSGEHQDATEDAQ